MLLGNEASVSHGSQSRCVVLDLVVNAPPFLDHHHPGNASCANQVRIEGLQATAKATKRSWWPRSESFAASAAKVRPYIWLGRECMGRPLAGCLIARQLPARELLVKKKHILRFSALELLVNF